MELPTNLQIVAATNNPHKLAEIRPMIEPDFRILSLEDIGCHQELPETSETLEGNSIQKASYVFQNFHVPCFADDTGLEVEALNGAPGVYSARYAGESKDSDRNMELLLRNLSGAGNRKARFRTVITLQGIGDTQVFEGILEGNILQSPRGLGGFGYDPVFQPLGHSATLAEMTMSEKNLISHRALAIGKLVAYLKSIKRREI